MVKEPGTFGFPAFAFVGYLCYNDGSKQYLYAVKMEEPIT